MSVQKGGLDETYQQFTVHETDLHDGREALHLPRQVVAVHVLAPGLRNDFSWPWPTGDFDELLHAAQCVLGHAADVGRRRGRGDDGERVDDEHTLPCRVDK